MTRVVQQLIVQLTTDYKMTNYLCVRGCGQPSLDICEDILVENGFKVTRLEH